MKWCIHALPISQTNKNGWGILKTQEDIVNSAIAQDNGTFKTFTIGHDGIWP